MLVYSTLHYIFDTLSFFEITLFTKVHIFTFANIKTTDLYISHKIYYVYICEYTNIITFVI